MTLSTSCTDAQPHTHTTLTGTLDTLTIVILSSLKLCLPSASPSHLTHSPLTIKSTIIITQINIMRSSPHASPHSSSPKPTLATLPFLLTLLSLCVVLARAGAFSLSSFPSTSPSSYLARQRGGSSNHDDAHTYTPRIREVRNGYTSDGRRRLHSLNELFSKSSSSSSSSQSNNNNNLKSLDPTVASFSSSSSSKGLFSRDGIFKVVGYAAVAYIGKQFFNGGRYDDEPNLSGKVCVITGGNTGIGKETAIRLAEMGARVIIACRNPERGEAAVKDIIAAVAPPSSSGVVASAGAATTSSSSNSKKRQPQVEALTMDLSDLKSIDRFANELSRRTEKVDILINNAGVMAISRLERTKDGFERHLGVNHLGHFHLTNRIFDLLLKGMEENVWVCVFVYVCM